MPAKNGWSYFATRLNGDGTERLIADNLPLAGMTFTNVLSGTNQLAATVPVEVARLKDDAGDGASIFKPWSSVIYAQLDGVIRGCGIVVSPPSSGQEVSLDCRGFRAWLDDRLYDGVYSKVHIDPLDVARHIWDKVQHERTSPPLADLGLVLQVSPEHSPVRIGEPTKKVEFTTGDDEDVAFDTGPYTLNWWDTHDLGKVWDDLAEVGEFDYYETHRWVGSGADKHIEHTLHVGYPQIGRRRSDLRFVVGENVIEEPDVEVDGEAYTNHVIVLGSGEGRKMRRGEWPISDKIGLYRPQVISDKALKSHKAATKRAERVAQAYQGLEDVKQVKVVNHPNAPLGSVGLGDTVTLRGNKRGWTGGLNMAVRVLSVTWEPDSGDRATLEVSRAERIVA